MRVLCVNPSLEGRMTFRSASSALRGIESLQVMDSLADAKDRLFGGSMFHALYLSDRFEDEVIREFVTGAKGSKGGADSAYMLTLDSGADEEFDPKYIIECGIDGFIKGPVQSAVLAGSIEKARQIHNKRQSERQKAGIDVLIAGILKNIDEAASKLSAAESISNETKNLRGINRMLRSLPADLQSIYFSKLIDRAESSPPGSSNGKAVSTVTSSGARIIRKSF